MEANAAAIRYVQFWAFKEMHDTCPQVRLSGKEGFAGVQMIYINEHGKEHYYPCFYPLITKENPRN